MALPMDREAAREGAPMDVLIGCAILLLAVAPAYLLQQWWRMR
jgi:hypothetical protein